jgi:hypothetical protein
MLKGLLSEQEVIATEVQPILQRIVFQKKKKLTVRYQQDYEGAASEMRKKYLRKKEGKGE